MKEYDEAFKIGFIGGSIESSVGYTHYIASQMDHRFELKAGCFSRNEEMNKKTALIWGIEQEHLFSDWKLLLREEKDYLDAIVILTPTPNHYEMIMEALHYNYAVITEKAMTTSYNKGYEITKKVNENNAFLAVTHNYTAYPMVRELKSMIEQGKLGKIVNINIEMPQESFIRLDKNGKKMLPQEWRLNDGIIPSISLDLGSHLFHMNYFLTSQNPSELVADMATFGNFPEVIDNISCMLKYKNGMRSQVWYGKSSLGHRNGLRVRVYGTEGSAEWFQIQPEELIVCRKDGERLIIDRASPYIDVICHNRYNRFKAGHPAGFIEAFGNLYFDIADKLYHHKNGKLCKSEWPYSTKHATIGLKISEAIQKSSLNKKWVKLKVNYE